jgi:IS30 family transposase
MTAEETLGRIRGLADARDVLEEELRRSVRAARDEGTSAWSIAWALGVDRSTVYRRYLSPTPGEAKAESGLSANGAAERRGQGTLEERAPERCDP